MTALRVLIALAKCGSTTAAAESLHMSQSAVSKQLLTLEALLDARIFCRRPAGLIPTDLGRIYIEQAQLAVKAMEDAAFRAAQLQADPHVLRLKMLPILGDRWLLPRLPDFTQKHPRIEVQYTTLSSDNPADRADGTFFFGRGSPHDSQAMRLFGKDVRLVCAPGYLARLDKPETLEDFARGTVFEHPATALAWAHLVSWHGRPDLQARNITRYEYYTLVLRATILGQGLALVPPQLIENELASGQLVNPGGIGYESSVSYWFTTPADRQPSTALKMFRRWLAQQVAPAGSPPSGNSACGQGD